jgi:hypothetical protein
MLRCSLIDRPHDSKECGDLLPRRRRARDVFEAVLVDMARPSPSPYPGGGDSVADSMKAASVELKSKSQSLVDLVELGTAHVADEVAKALGRNRGRLFDKYLNVFIA